jgi:hypothetical protein
MHSDQTHPGWAVKRATLVAPTLIISMVVFSRRRTSSADEKSIVDAPELMVITPLICFLNN